jgi:hypothetical protein
VLTRDRLEGWKQTRCVWPSFETAARLRERPPQDDGEFVARESEIDSDHCTSWMRLIMSAYFGPYLSHTGFTAAWNGFLSGTSMI